MNIVVGIVRSIFSRLAMFHRNVYIEVKQYPENTRLIVTNTSFSHNAQINIKEYGYLTNSGDLITKTYKPVLIGQLLSPEQQQELSFSKPNLSLDDIKYFFVRDSRKREYKKRIKLK